MGLPVPRFPAALHLTLALMLPAVGGHAQTPAFPDLSRSLLVDKDWVVGCDNTGQCRAVGYQAASADGSPPIAFAITRPPGAGAALQVEFSVDPEWRRAPLTLAVSLDDGPVVATLAERTPVATRDASALVHRMLDAHMATFRHEDQQWRLSLAGMKAVLLKMDTLQGRDGTPGALVRRGTRPESSVPERRYPPQLPAPVPPRTTAADEHLADAILAKVPPRDCDTLPSDQPPLARRVRRIARTQVLLIAECSRGTARSTFQFYLANDRAPYRPRPLLFPIDPVTQFDDVIAPDFDGRNVKTVELDGQGNCGEWLRWSWTGRNFVLAEQTQAPLCRGMKNGGYPIRLWVTDSR
jgi:hypothetical protein